MDIEKIMAEIDKEIQLWEQYKDIEESGLGGNVVKAAQYSGTIAGLRAAQAIILDNGKP